MDVSLLSMIIFTIITIIYFVFPSIGKQQLELKDVSINGVSAEFYSKNIYRLVYYIVAVIVSQLILNISYLTSKCGGALDKNIGSAFIFTFIPWVLIFGVMLAVLIVFPGFKSAFSDVLGYYVVAGHANDIFSSILIGTNINDEINKTTDANKKNELTHAAEAILKICGNKSILINQMNPDNFISIWNTLTPLITPGLEPNVLEKNKQDLLNLVVTKENIGEACWYIYTGILISSIVYYNLATRGCIKSVDQIKADHDAYIKEKEETDKQKELNNSTTYTIT